MLKNLSIKRLTLTVLLAASLNFGWGLVRGALDQLALERERLRLSEEYGGDHYTVSHCGGGPPTEIALRFWVGLFLVIGFIGSRLKGTRQTVVSVISLSGVTFIYLKWWSYVFVLARNAEIPVARINHLAYLAYGNYLDLAIAAATALLIATHLRQALQRFHEAPHGVSSS